MGRKKNKSEQALGKSKQEKEIIGNRFENKHIRVNKKRRNESRLKTIKKRKQENTKLNEKNYVILT
jgi:hypothetical protein